MNCNFVWPNNKYISFNHICGYTKGHTGVHRCKDCNVLKDEDDDEI